MHPRQCPHGGMLRTPVETLIFKVMAPFLVQVNFISCDFLKCLFFYYLFFFFCLFISSFWSPICVLNLCCLFSFRMSAHEK